MVKSGLVPEKYFVGHVELTTHFIAALGLLCYTLWFALSLLVKPQQKIIYVSLRNLLLLILTVLFFQLVYGGFMAGLRAGATAPTWPDINGNMIPDSMTELSPFTKNLVANPITIHFIHRVKDDLVAMAQYLRARTYALKGRYEQVKIDRVEEPITQVNNDELVQKELDAAGPITEVVFGKSSSMKIYNVTGEQAQQTLLKLGQLREENFRAAQEGSGKSSDTDIDPKTGAFDLFHHHFIARDLEQKTTAAYRLGMGDELLARGPGKDAFYLNRFADLSAMPVEMLSQTIEAGRSFANFTEAGKNSIRGLSAVWKGTAFARSTMSSTSLSFSFPY